MTSAGLGMLVPSACSWASACTDFDWEALMGERKPQQTAHVEVQAQHQPVSTQKCKKNQKYNLLDESSFDWGKTRTLEAHSLYLCVFLLYHIRHWSRWG